MKLVFKGYLFIYRLCKSTHTHTHTHTHTQTHTHTHMQLCIPGMTTECKYSNKNIQHKQPHNTKLHKTE